MSRKYHGSRVAKKNPAPKRFALLLALVLILVGTIGGTVAFLATRTNPVVNTFTPGEVTTDVVEKVEDGVKKAVAVKNTGNIPAYIRVAVVANTVDENGKITGAADLPNGWLNTTNWTAGTDGFYYYKGAVQPDTQTEDLLADGVSIDLTDKQITILASAIQSTPAEAVIDAWGFVPSAN